MKPLQRIVLNSNAQPYLRDIVSRGNILSANIVPYLARTDGVTTTWLPGDLDHDHLYTFMSGGINRGRGEDMLRLAVTLTENFLKEHTNNIVIVEDRFAKRNDPWIEHDLPRCPLMFNGDE